ncbi:MAG: penicillin acylase family protein [Bacteroidia bacterium]|nr:penicillin acylase family protein [Bacteroidia bacterium]
MKFFKFFLSAVILTALTVLLNNSLKINNTFVPPLGRLVDPVNGFWANMEPAQPQFQKALKMDGLEGEVHIYWDDRLVPHVFAQSTRDMFFAQGFVTASMRLWQMDFQTRAAAGRLSEVLYPTLGEKVLKFDRLQRRNGMLSSAKASAAEMMKDPLTAMVAQAYSDGINAYIERLSYRNLPLEYKLLNYRPEKWSPLKSALLLKYMAQMLTDNDSDLGIANAYKLFDKEDADLLYTRFPKGTTDPIIPSGTPWNFTVPRDSAAVADSLPAAVPSVAGFYPEMENPFYFEGIGSNNWAVTGAKSRSGKPILCNDPHLALNLPSIWFEIQLCSPEYNVYGASLPGSPCVISGFNNNIAWGVTNGTRDVRDWYEVEWKDASKSEYKWNGAWEKTEFEQDTIHIKGKDPLVQRIPVTRMGRVVYEDSLMTEGFGRDLAMNWTAFIPANELKTFILMNKAANHADYITALDNFGCPAQNFVFACANGDIAIKQQGAHLKYPAGTHWGIMKGGSSESLISEVIPYSQNPHVLNPARGFVSSANQHPTDSTYPYIYDGMFEHYRNRRINYLLTQNSGMDVEFMKTMQNDNYNTIASEYLPLMLSYVTPADWSGHENWLGILKSWNYFNDAGQVAPAIFESWLRHFKAMTYDEWDGVKGEKQLPGTYSTWLLLKDKPFSKVFDIKNTATVEDGKAICRLSLARALADLDSLSKGSDEALQWYKFKNTSVQHILQLKPFSRFGIKAGGNYSIINACSDRWGPSWRMIVSFENGVKAFGIYPGGQSGNPGSAYYANMIEDWAGGRYYELKFFKNADEAAAAETQHQKYFH